MSDAPQSPYDPPPEIAVEPQAITERADRDARNWGMFCHLAAAAFFALPGFGNIIGPLIVWLIKREEHPFIDEQGRESLNFQISMSIYALLAAPTMCLGIGFILLPAILIIDVVFTIIACMKASNGISYRYPLTIRFVK